MQDFEKLGVFYLGKQVEAASGEASDNLLLYDAKDLTTHAMMVGMTGSGKTGLALALLEEAAIDGIPAILIDPKGDLGNLMLQFPELRPEDFRPWVDEAEAARKGMSPEAFAAKTAETWRNGLAQWGQDGERIRRLQASAEFAIYTPGSIAGRPLQLLRSFDAPPAALLNDTTALRDRVMSAVSGLLGLLGIDADPVQSREHILLSNILDRAWQDGRDVDLTVLIQDIQTPPFDHVGVFALESFYPSKDRFALAMRVNNLLASPGFAAWMAGEPLDIQRLLHTPDGKPRVSILYLAHLSDAERMFFVTCLLTEVLAWMRTQPGTGSLRALLYMDEIFGYFPPTANPPSKLPMLTLLKQARAFGLGVVLSTQNPVDLDYKGLANCGTWFIGRLQTERDKQRVMEGLEGVAASTGDGFDRSAMERLLAGLGNRVFLMNNVHDDAPVLFQTRWAMSYLRGPLTLPQLSKLPGNAPAQTAPQRPTATQPAPQSDATPQPAAVAPVVPPDIPVFHLRPPQTGDDGTYTPTLVATYKLHFVDAKAAVDEWISRTWLVPFAATTGEPLWDEPVLYETADRDLVRDTPAQARYAALPASVTRPKVLATWTKSLAAALYQNATLDLHAYPELKMVSRPDEPLGDFRVRVCQILRERHDEQVAKLKAKYAPTLRTLSDQIRRAEAKVERERAQSGQRKMDTMLSVGATLLSAFLGRGRSQIGTVGRATTAMKSAGRIGKERADVAHAEESLEVLQQRMRDLEQQFETATAELSAVPHPETLQVATQAIRPRKSDILIEILGLCWVPDDTLRRST
ncbi:MAG TPA: type IV secretion system DNA-binding domain-containing protein [Kiritimatiellia bacterium]|mgnify:CR=1 FL=1|nr:type IV secretion system DNA-binding domain-containing protein [Kiritimatiellia bacterium]